jgi:hypothetical protein
MAITFEVSAVERATSPLAMPAEERALRLHKWRVEAMGASVPRFLPVYENGLLAAVHTAYADHRPLVISPDVIWLAIAQGFAQHVGLHAERLRSKFVRHAGKVTIEIRRDDFIKGSPDNAWPEVFHSFSDVIAGHIGRQRELVVCDFSTTGPCERAASEIVLLDAMQHYFEYVVVTMCGIPEITLEGTVEDWRAIRRRARALEEYELSWWTDALGPVLDALVATAEGRVNQRFWETLFKHSEGSGGPWVRGWINVLFPYLRDPEGGAHVQNPHMSAWQKNFDAGDAGATVRSQIPSGLSCAPFTWKVVEEEFAMHFLGGFVGVAQDEGTLALRPAIGWAVREGAPSDEERAADWLLADQARRGGALVAGWRIEASLTALEISHMLHAVARLSARGARLTCVPLGRFTDGPELPHAQHRMGFVVGVRVAEGGAQSRLSFSADQLRRALLAARSLPSALQQSLAELVPGGLPGEAMLFLAWGELRFTARNNEKQSLPVARGEANAGPVDVSPEAHEARVEAARSLGFEVSSIPYLVVG